jgi:hypothetical protein
MAFPPLLTLPDMAARRVKQNVALIEVEGENRVPWGAINEANSFEQSSSVSVESECWEKAADPAKLEIIVAVHKCTGRCNKSTWYDSRTQRLSSSL